MFEKLTAAAGLVVAVAVTAIAFIFTPTLGIFTGGVCAICGLIVFDRIKRKGWERAVSKQLRKIEQAQDDLASGVTGNREAINRLKDHVTETVLNTLPSPALPAQQRGRAALKEVEDDHIMPRAERPGAPQKRGYEDLVTGQHDLSDFAVRQVVSDAVRAQRIEVFLQPIVRLPQRKVRYYEMFARVRARPGLYLPAERYIKLAREDKMMKGIDQLLITEVLDMVRETAKLERAAPFFINVTPESLKSAPYMNKLLAFLGNARNLAPRLVFEMAQADFNTLPRPVTDIMLALGKLGCSFSIDNVTDMSFDIENLLRMKVNYIKISAAALIRKARNEAEFAEIQRLKRKLEGNSIAVIAEKIESEQMLKELMDYELNYGQGHLFGKPDLQIAYQQKGARGRKFY